MGKAYYKYKVSVAANMINISSTGVNYTQLEANKVKNQLPIDTKLLEIHEELSQTSLCFNCTAVFEHPIFIEGSEIKDLQKKTRDFGIAVKKDGEKEMYSFDKSDNLNFDEFVNKKSLLKEEENGK